MSPAARYKNHRFGAATTVPCRYCNRALTRGEATVEHVVPRSRGGKNARSNFDVSCYDCNVNKGDLSEAEFLALPVEERTRKRRWPPRLRQARIRAERIRKLTTPKKLRKRPILGTPEINDE